MKNKFFLTAAIFFICLSSIIVFAEEKDERIKICYTDYEGFFDLSESGVYSGYCIEYLKEISNYTGWRYDFIYAPLTECLSMIKNGQADFLAGIEYSEERTEHFAFSRHAMGEEYVMLYKNENDDSICYGEYEAFNGKTIAMLRDTQLNVLFDEFADKNHIEVSRVYYNTFEEMQTALEKKEVDLLVSGSINASKSGELVARLDSAPFFFITSHENEEKMDQLNKAMGKILESRPFFNADLYETYFGKIYENAVGWTREEANFIKESPPLKLACDKGVFPLEYIDLKTGEYKGVYADMLRLIEKNSGLKFEFIQTESYSKSRKLLEDGKVDLISKAYTDNGSLENEELRITASYYTADNMLIGKLGKSYGETMDLKIALTNTSESLISYFCQNFPNWEVVEYSSIDKALKAVEKEEADLTILNHIILQNVVNISNYKNLVPVFTWKVSVPIGLAMRADNKEILKTILDKAIYRISDEEWNQCIIQNTIEVTYKLSMKEWLEKSIPVIAIIVFAGALLILIITKKRETYYKKLAMRDDLTGIWGRNKFIAESEALINKNKGKLYYLIAFDIDNFRRLNENYGFQDGNKILMNVAQKFGKVFDKNAYYARLNSDYFIVLQEEIPKKELEEKIEEMADLEFSSKNGADKFIKLQLKAGVCKIEPRSAPVSITEYMDKAGVARKTIKGLRDIIYTYYNNELEEKLSFENEIESRMEAAVIKKEFVVYYQPKFQLDSETIIGAEALVRWLDPEKGLIPPGQFIPLFEKNGFVTRLDYFVFEEVFQQIRNWMDKGKEVVTISVNVSRLHILSGDFSEKFVWLLEKYQIPPELVEVELTESAFGVENSDILAMLKELKEHHLQVSIDDFGSGYSSLNLLKSMPVDVLKIDREFLTETKESKRSAVIVEQVVKMAKQLGIRTICEGVETKEQAEFLKQIGCDMVQGYLYAKPMPKEEFEKMF